MKEVTKREVVTFRCEQCGREGGRAIFTCPERPLGRCPYVEQWREKKLNLVEQVLLYNSNSGVRLQRTTLWGIELSYKWVTSKPVPIDLALPQPLAYPPSITAWVGWIKLSKLPIKLHKEMMMQAVAILRTTLIGLLAQGTSRSIISRSMSSKRGAYSHLLYMFT
jgi:hypothetical protein